MVNYSALGELRDQFYTDPLVADPLLADRYPSYTPEDQNLDYWRQLRLQTGIDKPRDELLNRPNPYPGYDPEDLRLPVWGSRQPAQPSKIPDPSNPDYEGMLPRSYGRNEPVTDAPPAGPPAYWEHSFVPDRELIADRRQYQDIPKPPSGRAPSGGNAYGVPADLGGPVPPPLPPQDELINTSKLPRNFEGDYGAYAQPRARAPAGDVVLRPNGTPAGVVPNMPAPSALTGVTPTFQQIAARSTDLNKLPGGVPFPTVQNPNAPPIRWVDKPPADRSFGTQPGEVPARVAPVTPTGDYVAPPKPPVNPEERIAAAAARSARPQPQKVAYTAPPAPAPMPNAPKDVQPAPTPKQTTSATAADRTQEIAAQTRRSYDSVANDYPILQKHEIATAPAPPGRRLEYWSPNEPGTPDRPRPPTIPMDKAGLEIPPDTPPLDILGDIVSHHMVKKDPVIKKYYEGFTNSLTPEQKEHLQAQYFYYTKNEGETRPYKVWEKNSGLPAYFRGYAFQQWPADFNQQAYTPEQRAHFDQMMQYLQSPQPALQ